MTAIFSASFIAIDLAAAASVSPPDSGSVHVPAATTSDARPSTSGPHSYCENCGRKVSGDTHLCSACSQRPQCRSCRRYLPERLIQSETGRCVACTNKVQKVRKACGTAVQEYHLHVGDTDVSYDEFIQVNGDEIRTIVNGLRRTQR